MPLPTISTADFKGFLKITVNSFKQEKLNDYIEQFYEQFVSEILGDESLIEIEENDFERWNDLFAKINYVNIDGKNARNSGLKAQIVKLIYFEIVRDSFQSTQVGKVNTANELSTRASNNEVSVIVFTRWNSAVRELKNSICKFITNYETITTELNGFTDNADNTYTLEVDNTLYIEIGDSLNVVGSEYAVLAYVENTSITIQASEVGLNFSSDVSWHPFSSVVFDSLEFMTI